MRAASSGRAAAAAAPSGSTPISPGAYHWLITLEGGLSPDPASAMSSYRVEIERRRNIGQQRRNGEVRRREMPRAVMIGGERR
jgi:hypothetical protein